MTNQKDGRASLQELKTRRDVWHAHVSRPIQLPEPSFILDLDSRHGTEARIFRHIHQMCLLHTENYSAANQIKHLYLVDAFFALAQAPNPLAMYAIARSMFELSAFLHEVQKRLEATSLALTSKNWQQVGERFFGLIVRARFATTHPIIRNMLLQQSVSQVRLKPFNVARCISNLATHHEHVDAETRYAILCDFVHHNIGSSTTANSGSGTSDVAQSSGGGMIFGTGPMTITQYEYPVSGKIDNALDELAPGFLRDSLACVQWLNLTPAGPFSQELVEAMTGSALGFEVLREPRRPA
jgi:hypothetical protein